MARRKRPVLGVDYIMDTDGRAQFTREYLLRLGDCCEHDCLYCPYDQCESVGDYQTTNPANLTAMTLNGAPLLTH